MSKKQDKKKRKIPIPDWAIGALLGGSVGLLLADLTGSLAFVPVFVIIFMLIFD